jgi:transcriptional regulator with XRE-family HTH domain
MSSYWAVLGRAGESDGLDSSDPFRQDVLMADANWQRLGDYVVARRAALGMRDRRAFAAATGVTDRTLGKLENGKKVSASTLGAVENQLGWAPGSCRRILAGGEPTAVPGGESPSRYSDPTLQHIAETPGLPPDVVRGLIALARNWRDQADQAEDADDLAAGDDGRQRSERRGA